ncbi:MAG: translation initiation factor eIF-2B, partial [Candidatus Thorarchaeota archaeon]
TKSIYRMIRDLHLDKTSGASELVKIALEILKTQLDSIKDEQMDIKDIIHELSVELLSVRPSMAPIINTMGYFLHDLENYTKKALLERYDAFPKERERVDNALISSFQSFIDNYKEKTPNIMLISYSTTIIKCLKQITAKDFSFYILEARPLLEGRRTAEILSLDFDTHLITDSSMGKFIKSVDIVLLGIDSIMQDGSIVNKIGSYPLACIAANNNKKVYAVGDSYKYNLKSHYGQEIIVEEKPIYEVYSKKIKKELFHVHNYYFDTTPSKYLNGIISDLGVLTIPEFLEEVVKTIPLEWFNSFL